MVNVTSYGATGNGVTLDTTAILSALAVSDTIVFPPGVYKIGSMNFPADRTIFFENNARIFIASGANVVWNSRIVASEDQWIFDCEDVPTNYSNHVVTPSIDTARPLTFNYSSTGVPDPTLAQSIITPLSVKWFGATGAGHKTNTVSTYYTTNTVPSTEFTDDTKALRFALTAVADSLNIAGVPSDSPAFGGPNTLYFPRGCYVHTETLYVSAGTFLTGDGATPVGGSVIYNMNPGNTQIVLQSCGTGGLAGGGSAHILRNLVLTTRPNSVSNPNSYVVKFEDNRLNFDTRFYNLRFSSSPFNGAMIYVNEKNKRYSSDLQDGLPVTMHIYDSMIDVCEGDFIRLGEIGSLSIRVYDTQFFDIWQQVVDTPQKVTADMPVINSLFEFNNCNFQACGVGHSGANRIFSPFVYSNDENAEFLFMDCFIVSEQVEERKSGGRIQLDAAKTLKVKDTLVRYLPYVTSDGCFFLEVDGTVETIVLEGNQFFNDNASAFATLFFNDQFTCTTLQVSNNTFSRQQGIHVFHNNPSAPVQTGLIGNNQFGTVTPSATSFYSTESLYGNVNPGVVVSGNVFATSQDLKGVALVNIGMKGRTEIYGVGAPVTGTHYQCDRVINAYPAVGQPKAWVCTVGGTPGTWVSEGNL